MHFNYGAGDGPDTVVQGHAGVGIGARIEHDAVEVESHALHLVDEQSLHIALVVVQLHLRIALPELLQVVVERGMSVDVGLPLSEKIQIGPVDDKYFHLLVFLGW